MKREDFFYFGKIIKTHGIKGEFSIRIDADQPAHYSHLKMLFIELTGKLVPYFIASLSIRSDKAYVMLEDIDSVDKALTLTGKDLYLPIEQLPRLRGNKFYFHEVKGFRLVDEVFGEIGPIAQVIEYPGQAVFQTFNSGKEVLIPVHDQFILKVDRRTKTINIKAPDGLIEMYMNG